MDSKKLEGPVRTGLLQFLYGFHIKICMTSSYTMKIYKNEITCNNT